MSLKILPGPPAVAQGSILIFSPARKTLTKLVLPLLLGVMLSALQTSNLLAAAPSLGTISPSSGFSAPGTVQTFTCVYTDADGWANLKKLHFLVSRNSTALVNSVHLYYNQNTNKLYLRDDANTAWLGGYAPGSPNTIKNSQVKLNCSSTIVSGSGTSLIVNWNISFKAAYSGKTYKTYLSAKDDSGGSADWTQKGTITIQAASDTTPPTGSITINNNAAYTASSSVTLNLSAVDSGSGMGSGTQMQFSNDNLTWSTPEAYAANKSWSLAISNGTKTVSVKYKDVAGNWSSAVSDTIVLDTIPPTASITSPANGATVSGTISISAAALDMWGVVAGVQFKLDGITLGVEDTTSPYDLLWNTTAASNSLHSLTAVARDIAGNTAVPASVKVTVNNVTATPTRPVVTDDGMWTDSSTQLHAKWSSSDAKSGVVEYQYSIGTYLSAADILNWTSTTANEITVTGLTLVLSSPYYFNVKAKNGAGLWSEVGSSDGIKYNPPPGICRFTPLDKSSFIEGDLVSIYACTSDNPGDVMEFQVSLDNLILQPWRINAGIACGLCSVYYGAALTYDWQTKTGDNGLHKIKVELRDNKVAPVFKEITIFIYKKPLGPPA